MTRAKLSLFVDGEGLDNETGEPLVKIDGEPDPVEMVTRQQSSTNLISRPVFRKWSGVLNVRWDADQFSATDVVNLLARVGMQVGVGAGRHDSKMSTGLGFGCFRVEMM
jgi:hypothetical protein